MTTEARASSPAAVPDRPRGEPAGPVGVGLLAIPLPLPLTVLAIAAGLALSWYYAPSLLLLFAGILFAALLDACTRGLGAHPAAVAAWRFSLVMLAFGPRRGAGDRLGRSSACRLRRSTCCCG